jgi:hypothetical protein
MGQGTLTVTDSFDALMGKRRGVSPGHARERLMLTQAEMRKALREVGLSRTAYAALHDLSVLPHDGTPEAQEHLRSVIVELIGAAGMAQFLTDWRLHGGALPKAMDEAMRGALADRLGEGNGWSPYTRRHEARVLVERLFVNEGRITFLSRPEMEAYLPVVAAVALAYRDESLEEVQPEPGEERYRPRGCKYLATCLGICPSVLLPLLMPWREVLTEEVASGNCDGLMTGITIELHSSKDLSIDAQGVVRSNHERKEFLGPLLEAIEKRRRGE